MGALCGKGSLEYSRVKDLRLSGKNQKLRPEEMRVMTWEDELDF